MGNDSWKINRIKLAGRQRDNSCNPTVTGWSASTTWHFGLQCPSVTGTWPAISSTCISLVSKLAPLKAHPSSNETAFHSTCFQNFQLFLSFKKKDYLQCAVFFFHWWMFSGVRRPNEWRGLHTHVWAMAKLCTKIKQLPQQLRKLTAFCQSSLFLHKTNHTLNSNDQALVCLYTHKWFVVRPVLNSIRNHKARFHSWYSHMTESFFSRLYYLQITTQSSLSQRPMRNFHSSKRPLDFHEVIEQCPLPPPNSKASRIKRKIVKPL